MDAVEKVADGTGVKLITVTVHREVPAGKPNPNTQKVYVGLEDAIQQYLERNNHHAPIDDVDCRNDMLVRTIVDYSRVIGYLTSVSDTVGTIELSQRGCELLEKKMLNDAARIQFCYLASEDEDCPNVEVVKTNLVYHPTITDNDKEEHNNEQ